MPGMGGGKRRARLRDMAQHRVEAALRNQLETLERIAERHVETAEQHARAFGRIDAAPRGAPRRRRGNEEVGRAACRERVWQCGWSAVESVSFKKKKTNNP